MFDEKISSIAFSDINNQIINNPIFHHEDQININLTLYHLFDKKQYALYIELFNKNEELVFNTTTLIGQKKSSSSNRIYNFNTNLIFNEKNQNTTVTDGDYKFRITLGTVSSIDKDNTADAEPKDSTFLYYSVYKNEAIN